MTTTESDEDLVFALDDAPDRCPSEKEVEFAISLQGGAGPEIVRPIVIRCNRVAGHGGVHGNIAHGVIKWTDDPPPTEPT